MKKLALTTLVLLGIVAAQPPQAQPPRPPLVACEAGKNVPCVVLATSPADIAGVWKQYQNNPAFAPQGGMGYIRYNPDGSFALGVTPEGTRTPTAPFPSGTFRFEGSRMILEVKGFPPEMPECARAVYEVRVLRMGDQPVALSFIPVEDTCKPRLSDLSQAVIFIGR